MTTLTADLATTQARDALHAAGIEPAKITSTDMGDCDWLGGPVVETEARVTYTDVDAARAALLALPGASLCEYHCMCVAVYRLAGAA